MLLGSEALKILSHCRVAVFGIGGVGGQAAEALVRGGIGAVDLIDDDKVCLSNINRQIFATHRTVGQYKVDAAEERLLEINPDVRIKKHKIFYIGETADSFDFTQYDYIVDAVDTVSAKLLLAENAQKADTPIISSMGAGNKLDAAAFEVADLYDTSVCPLARVMRHELKKRGIKKLKTVYSKEPAMTLAADAERCGSSAETEHIKRQTPGSCSFVPGVAGLIIAGEVIKDLTGVKNNC